MDPLTEARVVRAATRLLSGRTGILVAHRLSTTERAEQVAVLDGGRVIQQGSRHLLADQPGPFRALLDASEGESTVSFDEEDLAAVGTARRTGPPPAGPKLRPIP
jgi:ABC-type transport system involved in cytochrome bd biosynthesis fused ATPase/permease subunit